MAFQRITKSALFVVLTFGGGHWGINDALAEVVIPKCIETPTHSCGGTVGTNDDTPGGPSNEDGGGFDPAEGGDSRENEESSGDSSDSIESEIADSASDMLVRMDQIQATLAEIAARLEIDRCQLRAFNTYGPCRTVRNEWIADQYNQCNVAAAILGLETGPAGVVLLAACLGWEQYYSSEVDNYCNEVSQEAIRACTP